MPPPKLVSGYGPTKLFRIFSISGSIYKFLGVLVYVNNVERGQPEVYVVLEEAQIGLRIRESYSLDIDRMLQYQESMGLLDLTVSVPPKYGVVSALPKKVSLPSFFSAPTAITVNSNSSARFTTSLVSPGSSDLSRTKE